MSNDDTIISYAHLGPYSDLVAAARRSHPIMPLARPGLETQRVVREALWFVPGPPEPQDVRAERAWERDGIAGELVSWSVGYGPRTQAYLLRPSGVRGNLPAVVALHDHGGFKYFGKEKIADGPDPTHPLIPPYRDHYYGGRAYASALARAGFAVLVPDVFLWGSRRFPGEIVSIGVPADGDCEQSAEEIAAYNAATTAHEHVVEKYCAVLGTTLAAIVSFEDRVAVHYLASRPDVDSERIGCVGLSGGGARSALLQATCDQICAAVIVGMMSTYDGLLDHNVSCHTWMLFPSGWSRRGDWPDLAACRAPSPLLVQYDRDDGLFSAEGMQAAHERLESHYAFTGQPENYVGQFYPGPHQFSREMQDAAFSWLAAKLKDAGKGAL
jgi:dienelactone hydrolase